MSRWGWYILQELLRRLTLVLPGWYAEHRRDLPWRQDREPYHIWLSEIMLQQTRVEAVKGYYLRFLAALPDIQSLAACEDDRLHKLWEGLGYYTRVRNLKKAAQVIMTEYGGIFPQDYRSVLSLPGIGAYTAGAISSIAFGQPRAAVDGNVLRVVSRICRDESPIDLPATKAQVQQQLESVYPTDDPGTFTQALMELGATVCLPNGEPKCSACPCAGFCLGQDQWRTLPVKLPKRQRKQEDRTVFVLNCEDRYAIEKRPNSGLLAGLWQFPNVPGFLSEAEAVAWAQEAGLHPADLLLQIRRHHIFTHIRWDMQCYYIRVRCPSPRYIWLTLSQIDAGAALPTAFRQFREEIPDV